MVYKSCEWDEYSRKWVAIDSERQHERGALKYVRFSPQLFIVILYLFIVQFSFLGMVFFSFILGYAFFYLYTRAIVRSLVPYFAQHISFFFSVFCRFFFLIRFSDSDAPKCGGHIVCVYFRMMVKYDGIIIFPLFFSFSRAHFSFSCYVFFSLLLLFLFIFVRNIFFFSCRSIVAFCISTYNIILFSLCSQNLWPTQSKNFKQFSTLWLLLLLLLARWFFFSGIRDVFHSVLLLLYFFFQLVWVCSRDDISVYIAYYVWKLSGSYEHQGLRHHR